MKLASTDNPGRLQGSARRVVAPVLRGLWPVEVEGIENIPATGPALITPNHISFIDSVFILALMPRRILAVGKAEYLDSWHTRFLFPAVGMIPINRTSTSAAAAALTRAAQALDDGNLFLIYPEGTRSRDGYLHRGRTGAARLAMRTGAPIVPVGIRGTDAIQPPGSSLPRLFKPCRIQFGSPIHTERYDTGRITRAALRDLTDEIMYEIGQLSGQLYVDCYGPTVPGDTGTERAAALTVPT